MKRKSRRSDQEWFDLIQECRASGLPDKTWCEQHDITCSGLYYHIKRLRNKACEIPISAKKSMSSIHEVVPLKIQDDLMNVSIPCSNEAAHFVPELAVRLNYQGISIEITNQAAQQTIYNTISALQSLC